MNQIPNIEDEKTGIEYFRWRDELMSLLKKIRENIAFSKSKLWDYTNDDLIEDFCAKIEQKAREEERKKVLAEIDRLGNFWTNNGTWKVPTEQEMGDDSFKAFKFGKVELLNDLKNFIKNL